MANKTEYSRLLLKRSTVFGVEPTIPSGTTIDNTWLPTDILVGEGFLNVNDDRLFYRTLNGIIEVPMSGFSSDNYFTDSAVVSGSTVIFNRNDTPAAYSVDLSSFTSNIYNTDGLIDNVRTVAFNNDLEFSGTGFATQYRVNFYSLGSDFASNTYSRTGNNSTINDGTDVTELNQSPNTIRLGNDSDLGGELTAFVLNNRRIIASSEVSTFAGIEYLNDYSSNFVNRSLVDKEYVDLEISSATSALTSNNIYNIDGVLTGDRVVDMGDDQFILFSGTNRYSKFEVLTEFNNIDYGLVISPDSGSNLYFLNNTNSDVNTVEVGATGILINAVSGGTLDTAILVDRGLIKVGSNVPNFAGALYDGDYSSNYVNRSLVDKEYVDRNGFQYDIGDYVVSEGGIIINREKSGSTEEYWVITADDIDTVVVASNISPSSLTLSLWDGESNTQAIISQGGHTNSAAKICDDLNLSGFTDWYLPSIYEWDFAFDYRVIKSVDQNGTGFQDAPNLNGYWTSTNRASTASQYEVARPRTNTFGGVEYNVSTNRPNVRAIRRFTI